MGLAGGNRPHPRAVVFDLDRCLIDSRAAWRYCIEEAIAAAGGRRVSAADLVEEYHLRPWRHALGVLLDSPETVERCEGLAQTMFERSGMKKLLVHEGVGMALDALRAERIELGGISRSPHITALKQVQSTGLDRFLAVLSATPAGERWTPLPRFEHCVAFLEAPPAESAFVSGEPADLREVAGRGVRAFAAGWAAAGAVPEGSVEGVISAPADCAPLLLRYWASHFRPRA